MVCCQYVVCTCLVRLCVVDCALEVVDRFATMLPAQSEKCRGSGVPGTWAATQDDEVGVVFGFLFGSGSVT